MGDVRFFNPKTNPRIFSIQPDRVLQNGNGIENGKSGSNEISQKPQSSILDRYRVLLKDRDDELRVSDEDEDVPAPTTGEIVRVYELLLNELTLNSKPLITDLTIIAGEQRQHGEGIADAICARIIEVPVEHKLPSLYLLDSIVKNIGREYVKHFSSRLPEVFCVAYKQVNPNQHPSMRHLFRTWSAVFPRSVLQKIEVQLQFPPAANNQSSGATPVRAPESPRPAHGIHVNPMYLEARRQFDTSTADGKFQSSRDASSNSKYGQDSPGRYDEYDSDNAALTVRSNLTNSARPNKLLPFSNTRPARDELAADDSPRWLGERDSPSHPGYDYGLKVRRDVEVSESQRKHPSDDGYQKFENRRLYSLSNGREHETTKALIDAYGTDERTLNHKSWRDTNGVRSKMGVNSWKHTEEEEFDWEDMSPTLADNVRSNDFLSSSIPSFGNSRTASHHQVQASLDADPRRSNWSGRVQPYVADSSTISEQAIPTLGSYHGSNIPRSQIERNQLLDSQYPQDPRIPFPASISSSSTGDKIFPFRGNVLDTDAQFSRPPLPSTSGSSGLHAVNMETRSAGVPSVSGGWRPANMQNSHPFPPISVLPQHRPIGSRFITAGDTVTSQGPNTSLFLPEQQFENLEHRITGSANVQQLPNLRGGPLPLNQHNQAQNPLLRTQFPSPSVMPPNYDYTRQGSGTASSTAGIHWPMPTHNFPNSSMHLHGRPLPPLPPGPPPFPSHMFPPSQFPGPVPNQPPGGGAFAGLINSLMAQGVLSLPNQVPREGTVGLEFNADALKIRHESAITALYGNLPRQCKTCGLRFKSQEEHSSHMDWHVTKNRVNKNRKQKPSRKWFVNETMWLSGAEAVGTDSVPGFLPPETTVEQKEEEELAVPADEDQTTCALCGEKFDDFYSDETEEWMYRGAVYLNAPIGLPYGLDRSNLGPIVHAKCRPDSNVPTTLEDFGLEGGHNEEGSERKRQRTS